MAKRLMAEKLTDVLAEHVVLDLIEGTGEETGKVFVRGEFGNATKPTANGRLYPPGLWEGCIGYLGEKLKDRKVLGELDHPSDGRTALARASHVITSLKLKGGVVIGEAEILDTAKGRDLKAILSAGVPVGISSRGYGSTKTDSKGNEVVQEDYKLVTFDFVAEPADDTAYPEAFFEGVEMPMDADREKVLAAKFAKEVILPSEKDKDPLQAKFEKLMAGESDDAPEEQALRQEFAAEILAKIGELRQEVEAEVRAELLADPSLAGAKTALEHIVSVIAPFVPAGSEAEVAKDSKIEALANRIAELELQLAE